MLSHEQTNKQPRTHTEHTSKKKETETVYFHPRTQTQTKSKDIKFFHSKSKFSFVLCELLQTIAAK